MNRWSLRLRLTVLYGGLFFLAGAVVLGVTYFLVERSLDERLGLGRDMDIFPTRLNGTTTDVNGKTIDLTEMINKVRQQQQDLRDETLNSLVTDGSIALVGVGLAASAFGWLIAGRALQPLSRITDTARRIASASDRGLHERIPLSGRRDEVKELAGAFNTMLERLDRSFDGQRRFVANASHELRTPLALNRALAELAITRPDTTAQTRQLGESLLSVGERHERLIDGLLTLAESEAPVAERVTVDIGEVARHVLALNTPAAQAAGIQVTADIEPAPVSGDPLLLERLVQNLVENGIRHNTAAGWLSVRTTADDDHIRLVVQNSGPPVAGYEVDTLFQPFRRLRNERTGQGSDRGFGLGLSIVRAVAQAHGGEVHAVPGSAGGLTMTVTLPADRNA